ncbi:hydrogenase subunit MbhD domain-containing protein [Sorangium sp. So ce1097]|uniref:hydrogenase subunit MbhD domain-containing protein n=1 Tax=Sorangium sp. So ce1097 TaxID=3133330 RepID=UPI003F5D626F
MSEVDWAMDGVLACVLPFLSWRALATDDPPKAVVLFLAFGLLSAVTWARLGAPDIALVEAAIGTGFTGALLMSALGWIGPAKEAPQPPSRYRRALLFMPLAGLVLLLGAVVFSLPDTSRGLTDEVLGHVEPAGVSYPVTAVLLNFRGYDTLLEIAVLLLAALGVQAQLRPAMERDGVAPAGPMLPALVRQLIPCMILVAGYLLWRGSRAPGGAFQAGSILGGGAILLLLARAAPPPSMSSIVVRAALLVGPACFLAVAVAPLVAGRHVLEYPSAWAGTLILCVESALTISIAMVLAMFFPSTRQPDRAGERIHQEDGA